MTYIPRLMVVNDILMVHKIWVENEVGVYDFRNYYNEGSF